MMDAEIASSSTVVAVVFAVWLVWQLSELAVVVGLVAAVWQQSRVQRAARRRLERSAQRLRELRR